ncbi:MAG: FliH/SctL family protein [Pseudooceanicola sp.]
MQFVFDRNFDGDARPARPGTVQPAAIYTQKELEEAIALARAEGYSDGHTAGRAEAAIVSEDSAAERQLRAVEAVAPMLDRLFADKDRHHKALECQMIDFTVSVLEQVAPQAVEALARDQALREAENAIHMALGSSVLRVYFAPDEAEDAGKQLHRVVRMQGYSGRVEVLPDPELAPGDVRAEWDHGVMRYSFNEVCDRILKALQAARAEADSRIADAKAGE